jgi:hypothetical protein
LWLKSIAAGLGSRSNIGKSTIQANSNRSRSVSPSSSPITTRAFAATGSNSSARPGDEEDGIAHAKAELRASPRSAPVQAPWRSARQPRAVLPAFEPSRQKI